MPIPPRWIDFGNHWTGGWMGPHRWPGLFGKWEGITFVLLLLCVQIRTLDVHNSFLFLLQLSYCKTDGNSFCVCVWVWMGGGRGLSHQERWRLAKACLMKLVTLCTTVCTSLRARSQSNLSTHNHNPQLVISSRFLALLNHHLDLTSLLFTV